MLWHVLWRLLRRVLWRLLGLVLRAMLWPVPLLLEPALLSPQVSRLVVLRLRLWRVLLERLSQRAARLLRPLRFVRELDRHRLRWELRMRGNLRLR